MKIRKLDISGFKSFVDRTVLQFDYDVTCIVGPNGCGKSNIVDAIRWVMGTQSAKQLRGKAMEDVIFNGSESRGPQSFAEVTLTFDNTDRSAPMEYSNYSEITVTRRLDRSGTSEYLINKIPVRLKDITELFLGTGVGREAYSIVEQGRIGLIVSAKPEDRRQLIEEAAGITKFKARKRSAESKMNHTRQNLLRVSDIIEEIGKNLASLKRQARKAERYKAYRQEIRDLELWVASHRWLELRGEHGVLKKEIERSSAKIEGMRVAQRLREAETESRRLALSEMETKVESSQTRAYELDNSVKLLESQIEHHLEQLPTLRELESSAISELEKLEKSHRELSIDLETLSARLQEVEEVERAESQVLQQEEESLESKRRSAEEAEQILNRDKNKVAESDTRIARADVVISNLKKRREDSKIRLEKLDQERVGLESRVVEYHQNVDELKARYEGLMGGQDQIASRKGQIEEQLRQLREEIGVSDTGVKELQLELANKRSRLKSLQEIQQRFEGVGAGVRAVMSSCGADSDNQEGIRVLGLLADRFECPAQLTNALAAALAEKLQYIVVEGLETGLRAIDFLREGKRGRATFISHLPVGSTGNRPEIPHQSGVRGYLLDMIQVDPEDELLMKHLIGDVVLLDNLELATRIQLSGVTNVTFVTEKGDVLRADGSLSGGEGEDIGAHLIQVKAEIRMLEEEVKRLEGLVQDAVDHHGQLRNGIAQRQAALEATRSDAHEKEIALVQVDRDLKGIEESKREVKQRIESLTDEINELTLLLEQADDEENEAHAEREMSLQAEAAAREAVAAAEEVHRVRRAAVEQQSIVVTEVKVRAAQAKQQAESDRDAAQRLQRSLSDMVSRERRLRTDAKQFAMDQGEIAGRVAADRETLEMSIQEAMKAADIVSSLRADYEQAREILLTDEMEERKLRVAIEEIASESSSWIVKEREVAMELEHLVSGIEQRHRIVLPKVLTDYHDREIPDQSTLSRISDLQRVVERMGEINLTAIDEYEERSQRHEKLTEQRQDLEQALSQLEKAIRKMNRESRRLFRETFHEVNKRFQVMFPHMFGGGKAELRLTDPDDLLESGIDIVAMPPGKKLGLIELMSGGEKALTAISLILALFQYKPSPFCLLDEVDAPLDEANIGRFSEIVKEMTSQSQFIIITHSRQTIMIADVLYGITMEIPGISKMVSVKLREGDSHKPLPHLIDDTAAVA